MSVKSGQVIADTFRTANPTTGADADATGTPTATLYVNGEANAATVTVTKPTGTGLYKFSVTLPTLSAGDVVRVEATATVATVAGSGTVFEDTADTKRVSDLNDLTAAATADAVWDENVTGHTDGTKMGGYVYTGSVQADLAYDNTVTLLQRITTAITPTLVAEAVRDLATSGLTALKSIIDAIKTQTDKLTFTTPGKVDASATVDTTGLALEATAQSILEDTGTTLPALITADDAPPAGYTRITSATYGTLLAGTVIDAYAAADTTYATPLVPNVTVASNGSWHIDLPDAATYTLVGRLAGKDDTTQTVVIP